MRPLKLKFRGLRSYRGELEIDFTDRKLMAIVGDTGAGKSSILEALFFALYGGSSWEQRGGTSLIAAGGDGNLAVELTFRAAGRTWQVRRTASITGRPAAVHHLVGLDDGQEVDGARAVNEKIRDVVGLDGTTFLKAVVLPQGRFQELLHTNKSDRPGVLKSILGLDELADMREHVDTALRRIEPQLKALTHQRAGLLPDPKSVLADTEEQLSRLHGRSEALNRAKRTIATARVEEAAAESRAGTCRTVAADLAAEVPDGVEHQYQSLVALDASFVHELAEIDDRIRVAEQRETALDMEFNAADANGNGVAGTATALTTIDGLLRQLPLIQQEHDRIVGERGEIDTVRQELDRDENQLTQMESAADAADELHETSAQQFKRRQKLLADFEQAAGNWTEACKSAKQALNDREFWENKLKEVEAKDQEAQRAVEEASERLAAAERANAAAHAASSCQPGQACPVCTQTLPENFSPPESDGIAEAKAIYAKAKKHAKAVTDEHGSVFQSFSAAQATSNTEAKAVATATSARTAAGDAAYAEFESLIPELDDTETLALMTAALTVSAETAGTTEEAAQQARGAAIAESARLAEARQAMIRRQSALDESTNALEQRNRDAQATYAKLPDLYRSGNHPSSSTLAEDKLHAEQQKLELAKLTQELDETRSDLMEMRQERVVLERQHDREVVQPARKLREPLIRATARAQDAARLTEQPPAPTFPASSDFAEEARWAIEVVTRVGVLVATCQEEVGRQATLALSAQGRAATALQEVDVVDETELENRQHELVGHAAIAQQHHDTALNQLPLITELDTRIAAVQPVVEGLGELHRLLADGKFPAAVVQRRQRALLGTASDLLNAMTGHKFSFAQDFLVVDNELGQPRNVRTLSGGETFLASLALALALVELTSRGGARAEALFLDEGFGTLDANALDEALDALARQAGEERLVAVISHLRSVAANVDDILLVTKNFSGSQARWLTAAERDQIITAEVDKGLLE